MKNPLHRLSLRTLKFFLRFMRRTHELFTGAGVAFVSAALIIGFFMLVWWGIGAVKGAIELRLERALVERLLTLLSPRESLPDGRQAHPPASTDILETPAIRQFTRSSGSDLSFVSASFSDLFSGTGWLDEAATTMYHDKNATAFLFEPRFELLRGTPPAFAVEPGENGNGTVERRGEIYEGRVNGELLVSSPYEGAFGFGGSGDNSLAVYGAYEGAAFQFLDGARRDVSQLFGIRMMGGGFAPAVVRDAALRAWYVFPRTGEPVRFLKLFENGNGEIIGAADLTNKILERVGLNAKLADIKMGTDGSVWMGFDANGATEWFRFVDRGFAWAGSTVVSGDLNDGRNAEVRRARISRVNLADAGANAKFYLANSEGKWWPVGVGEWLTFPDPEGKNLFWRADFSGTGTRPTSPFFDLIQVEYFIAFTE